MTLKDVDGKTILPMNVLIAKEGDRGLQGEVGGARGGARDTRSLDWH
jgi:hypothetical protein